MASIRERGKGWQARVTRRGFPAEVKTFGSKVEAQAWARAVECAMDQGTFQSRATADNTTLGELLERYSAEVSPLKKGAKNEIIRLGAMRRQRLARFALSNLTASAIAAYRDERLSTVAAGTVIRDLALLSSVLNHARREWGFAIRNVVEDIRKPRQPQGRERVLSADEEQALLMAAAPINRRSPWLQPVIILALETAMRRGELLALRWENISLEKRTAVLPDTKNGARRIVPLSTRAVAVLRAMPCSIDGTVFPISAPALHLRFKLACKRAGILGVHFHDLRHTATTRLAEKLPNLAELSAVTGHKSLQMLKRYFHPDAEVLARKLG
ncbi:MAG: site-specific integrase [Rhodocyclaceae bacterium]|nr:site-specific integrase [Rhodocyclaceae bacterium]